MKPIDSIMKDMERDFFTPKMDEVFNIVNDQQWSPFLNHGYKNVDGSNVIKYEQEDLIWENQINLYTHLLEIFKKYNLKFEEIDLLDVGCGFGQGSHMIKKYYKPKTVTGLDFNLSFINHAKSKFNNIDYVYGSATEMPFADNSFDLITNIESLHHYKYTHFYYREAYRVLRPGGYLLMCDPFLPYRNDFVSESFFDRSGFYMTDKINITPMVIKACLDDINNFESKHPNINNNKIKFFKDIAKEKHEVYSSNHHVFLSYIYYKV